MTKYVYQDHQGLPAIAHAVGIPVETLRTRINDLNMPLEAAIQAGKSARLTRSRYEYRGVRGLSHIADAFGINVSTLKNRLRKGWTLTKAVETPLHHHHRAARHARYEYQGVKGLTHIADVVGLNVSTLRARLKKGLSLTEAVKRPKHHSATRGRPQNAPTPDLLSDTWKRALGMSVPEKNDVKKREKS